jgi:hypothetical protein
LAIKIGDTFFWKDGGHLWVVISDPTIHAGEFVIVNLTGNQSRAGKECILVVGDHKWITKETYVNFGDAKKMGPTEEANLSQQISAGTMKMHVPMSATTLVKIIAAGKVSKAIPTGLIPYL